jgi:enamine deaminase RidA (YjgF/YER057c/UK114 family)
VESPPASTVVVTRLGRPEYLVEIEVVGVVSRD